MKAHAVVVTYHPVVSRLDEMAQALKQAGVGMIVVDNSEPSVSLGLGDAALVVSLEENCGIAAAQNIGIRKALESGSEAIMFFDQDSLVSPELVTQLLQPLGTAEPQIVAPVFFDEKQGFEYPAVRVNRLGFRKKVYPAAWHRPEPVDIVISSGSAANRKAFEVVGLMNESLFIDYVDTEWCLRARYQGVPITVLPSARMLHSIGDNSLNFRVARVPVHGAYRRYYRVRNSLYLLGLPHVPKMLSIREIAFSFVHQAIIIAYISGRKQYLRYFFKALCDGLRGKMGKMK